MAPARILLVALVFTGAAFPQNSSRKIRSEPGAVAARAGSAVRWRDDLTAALTEASDGGKPVFWYVPTLSGSPMDRRPEIDRYMMAGPFSWPSTIALLNDHFVPVRQRASGEAQRRYGLLRQKFIEPGYLVLGGDGQERARMDQITTFHPRWFEAPLRELVGLGAGPLIVTPQLQPCWNAYRGGDFAAAEKLLTSTIAEVQLEPAARAEAQFLLGAVFDRSGRSARCVEVWDALVASMPDQPLAWKAAAEAEGHGPFVRGFEDFLPLSNAALKASGLGSRAAADAYEDAELWRRCLAFLLAMDRGDGDYTDSRYDFGGTDSLPNVYAAVTALVGEALLEASHRRQALELDAATCKQLDATLDRILDSAIDSGRLNPLDRDEIVWAHAYRIRLLSRWAELRPASAAQLKPKLQAAVDALIGLQPDSGAWFHEYPNPFAIATALTALCHARSAGAEVSDATIARGTAALSRCRGRNGGYTYGYRPRGEPRTGVPGSAGRMPLCELALRQWSRSDDDRLRAALTAAFEHHDLLAAVRKYDDHADSHGYGGFFFWYDMHGRTEAILQLPEGDAGRQRWIARQRELVLALPEFDGCFVDSHELGRVYGTAMALLCLAMTE